MPFTLRRMTLDDYDDTYRLWASAGGISLGEDDTREGIARYLRRNPTSCFVAIDGQDVVGVCLSGHDGRRGILRHLVVRADCRKRGIATELIRACLSALAAEGITLCNIFVMDDNPAGLAFWEHAGFYRLEDNYRTLQHSTRV